MDIDNKFKKEKEIFFAEISKATDSRYVILISHLYIEHLMDRYIHTKLPEDAALTGKNGFGFRDKLKLVKAYGEIDTQLVDAIRQLNAIRNNCVHVFAHNIGAEAITKFGRTLGENYKRIKEKYPESEKDVIVPISHFISGKMLALVLIAEGYERGE